MAVLNHRAVWAGLPCTHLISSPIFLSAKNAEIASKTAEVRVLASLRDQLKQELTHLKREWADLLRMGEEEVKAKDKAEVNHSEYCSKLF